MQCNKNSPYFPCGFRIRAKIRENTYHFIIKGSTSFEKWGKFRKSLHKFRFPSSLNFDCSNSLFFIISFHCSFFYTIFKRAVRRPPYLLHIYYISQHHLFRTVPDIVHHSYPLHLILRLQLLRHSLLCFHLFHQSLHHLITFFVRLVQIFI